MSVTPIDGVTFFTYYLKKQINYGKEKKFNYNRLKWL